MIWVSMCSAGLWIAPQLWVVSTDYSNWALVCTTSVSLGGGQPAQVRAADDHVR